MQTSKDGSLSLLSPDSSGLESNLLGSSFSKNGYVTKNTMNIKIYKYAIVKEVKVISVHRHVPILLMVPVSLL